jgi:hypothetical protein
MRKSYKMALLAIPALLLLGADPALARGTFLKTWQQIYPSSLSDDNVINGTGKVCQLCHDSSSGGGSWMGYGWDMREQLNAGASVADAILAIGLYNSDVDPDASDNSTEINADTQPGWTTGANNTIYFKDGSVVTGQMPPGNILGNLDPVVVPQEADINLNPTNLAFGSVLVGESVNLPASVENLGNSDLNVSQISLCAGTSSEYSWSPDAVFSVGAGGSNTLTVNYAPVDDGDDFGCLEISSDDPDESSAILNLEGSGQTPTAPQPDINLNPVAIDFGDVAVGTPSSLQTEVQNLGDADLVVSMVNLCAGTSAEYSWNGGNFIVAPGASQAVTVNYTPVDDGLDQGCLDFSSNDPDESVASLGLSGSGVTLIAEVDLDIVSFSVGKKLSLARVKPISAKLVIKNYGNTDEPRQATVTAEQSGLVVYSETLAVSASTDGSRTTYKFPGYTPTAIGDILWTASIADDNADIDVVTAVTKVTK